MEELRSVTWPPEPVRTARLVLRAPDTRNRAALVELLASPEVPTYLGTGSAPGRRRAALGVDGRGRR